MKKKKLKNYTSNSHAYPLVPLHALSSTPFVVITMQFSAAKYLPPAPLLSGFKGAHLKKLIKIKIF